MELADSYDSISLVPAEHMSLYVEKDGKAVLQLTGLKTQGDFDRFATALKARLADQTADLKAAQDAGLSRDDIVALIKEVATPPGAGDGRDNGAGSGNGDDSAAVHELRRQLAEVQEQLATSNTDREAAQATATATTIKNALTGAAAKAGVRPEAVDSLVALVSPNFEVAADGTVVIKLEGNKLAGVTPNAKPDEVLATVKRAPDYSYFWPESTGGGGSSNGAGGGGGGGGGGNSDNPWSKDGWNMTKQGQQVTANRAEAETLAKAAGSTIGAVKPPD